MAEDKQDKEGEEQPKKKGLSPIILVAVGAALGGAGVVFLGPQPSVHEEAHGPPAPVIERVEHPDVITRQFNAKKKRGSATAMVSFRFVYRRDRAHDHEVMESLATNWNVMMSRVLLVLMQQAPNDLNTEEGLRHLTKRLTAEMSLTLFPEGQAVVDDIIWDKVMVQ